MTHRILIVLTAIALLFSAKEATAHPGSGIVVDRQGNVYFVDTGSGVWKISRDGTLTRVEGPAYHWMAIDVDGRLAGVTLPSFPGATVARARGNSSIILSSDFPVAVGPDGSLYYPWYESERVQIFRLSPAGKTTVFKSLMPGRTRDGEMRWRNGIVVGPDGSVYYTEDRGVRKISPDGGLSTVIADLVVPGCDTVAGIEPELGPYLRGLDVDTNGTVYVAAPGCRTVLKITPDKKVTTVFRASSPWSPTSVARHGSDLYMLEYLHTEGDDRSEWLARVKKVAADGTITTVAAVER